MSPAETSSTERAIARSGAPMSAASSAARSTANTTATATASRSTRAIVVSAPAEPVTSRTTMPNAATGRTAAAIRPSVRRERKPRPELRYVARLVVDVPEAVTEASGISWTGSPDGLPYSA